MITFALRVQSYLRLKYNDMCLSPEFDETGQPPATWRWSGEGGIRTHGGPEGHNGFRDRPIQPLWHLSEQRRVLYPITPRLRTIQAEWTGPAHAIMND